MNVQKILAIALIFVGVMGVGYGGFSFTSETHNADLGPIHMSFSDKEHINIPIWAGIAAILAGGALLLKRRIF